MTARRLFNIPMLERAMYADELSIDVLTRNDQDRFGIDESVTHFILARSHGKRRERIRIIASPEELQKLANLILSLDTQRPD